ncbi:MAG: hypothetical protein WC609_03160 [Candidatus Paceibacterota bacterium]|jgi:uncharacterized membrane protein (GlpM family)
MKSLLIYFITGGLFTALIVFLEESGFRLWSGLATLVPVFTLVSYVFIGQSQGGLAVSQHAKFVLWGTVVSWIPYMIAIIYLAPKIGPHKAIILGLGIFFVLALAFIAVTAYFHLFQ